MKTNKIWRINKNVLPQNVDHAGIMWHGSYFNWLEESRIKALSEVGINYYKLTKEGYEFPLINASIKYILPLYLGENISIESIFTIGKSPKINVKSKFLNLEKKIATIAEVDLVFINKINLSIIRNRPDFLSKALYKLN